MTDSALPGTLVIAALALALGFVPPARAGVALVLAFGCSIAARTINVPLAPESGLLACWLGVCALAIATWLPTRWTPVVTLAAAAAAGMIAGVALAPVATYTALGSCMLAASLFVPARFAVERGFGIVPRVVASWLFAVAVLAALLPLVVPHPGYVADHRG